MTDRITNLSEPPVVGAFYLVPTVRAEWIGNWSAWPVFLPLHEDGRFFDFKDEHYHPDPRFLDARTWRRMGASPIGHDDDFALNEAQRKPIHAPRWGGPLPEVAWRRMKCKRLTVAYQHGHQKQVVNLRQHYAGQQCSAARTGWVCPHQNWPMGTLTPDQDGYLTCPLHGLRVRAVDGIVEPSPAPLQTAAPPTDGPKGQDGQDRDEHPSSTPIQGSGDSREGGRS